MSPEAIFTTAVSALISIVIGFATSYIAFRVLLERFMARMDEREKHMVDWRKDIRSDVDELKRAAAALELTLALLRNIRADADELKRSATLLEMSFALLRQAVTGLETVVGDRRHGLVLEMHDFKTEMRNTLLDRRDAEKNRRRDDPQ